MANGIKTWALTTSWKVLYQGDVCFCVFRNKNGFPGRVNERRHQGAAGGKSGSITGGREDISAVMSSKKMFLSKFFNLKIDFSTDNYRNYKSQNALLWEHPNT